MTLQGLLRPRPRRPREAHASKTVSEEGLYSLDRGDPEGSGDDQEISTRISTKSLA